MSETIEYYDNNAENYADSTANIDFSEMQDAFLSEIKAGAFILDFGCGSGRDLLYFLQKGYNVTALDGSSAMCRIARKKTGIYTWKLRNMLLAIMRKKGLRWYQSHLWRMGFLM